MYIHQCPECGKQYSTQERVNRVKCPYCGAETNVAYSDQQPNQWQQPSSATNDVFSNGPSGKSRGVAGLLALFLGTLGVHYFYIDKSTAGIVFLLLSLVSCGTITAIISIIQGVLFFTSTQEEFERKWVNSPSSIPFF